MYNVDDAVARVDSYVVSVAGGGNHIGERTLVRIDGVGRSSATATLLEANGEPAENDEPVESAAAGGRTRRGGRGGRRRSRAPASDS